MGYFITLIAKYYYSDDKSIEQLSNIIKRKILEFDLENYQEYRYHNKIITVCDGLFNGNIERTFKEREYIPIYESEINFIDSLPNDKQKKLMFTLFAIARYMNSDGWINKKESKDISEVFKLANVTLSSDKRNALLHELYINGYITFGKKVDNLNIRIDMNNSGDIVYRIKEFSNLGNQYIGNFKKGFKQCKNCGRVIRDTVKNRKYCKSCANIINRNNTKERMKHIRNAKMFEAHVSEIP